MFYIHPPKGKVALHVLENCVFARQEYLELLDDGNADSFTGNFEYLLENSVCDSIGHFTLRLISAASTELWTSWIRREALLFEQRLNHSSVRQIHRLFRNILKHLKKREIIESSIEKALIEISVHFLKPDIFHHISEKNHGSDCRKYKCEVPFVCVPDLVQQRKIDLCRGNATVICSEWKIVLLSLFRKFITEEKKRLSLSADYLVSYDPRLVSMKQRIQSRSLAKHPDNGSITSTNIDTKSLNFPLCMRHLHAILKEKHRLSHHARFYYSLFLKECGMKIDDAIDYWKQEYSKPHVCQSGCTHSWQTDERKFLYSIRHLYGLEGGRKNYKTPNCKMICTDIPGLRYEGGCPFKNFDENTLGMLLRTYINDTEVQERFVNVANETPEIACSTFFQIVHKLEGEKPVIYSPVQYYMKAMKDTEIK